MLYDPADRKIEGRQIVAGWLICIALLVTIFGGTPAGQQVMRGIHVVAAAFRAVAPERAIGECLDKRREDTAVPTRGMAA